MSTRRSDGTSFRTSSSRSSRERSSRPLHTTCDTSGADTPRARPRLSRGPRLELHRAMIHLDGEVDRLALELAADLPNLRGDHLLEPVEGQVRGALAARSACEDEGVVEL